MLCGVCASSCASAPSMISYSSILSCGWLFFFFGLDNFVGKDYFFFLVKTIFFFGKD